MEPHLHNTLPVDWPFDSPPQRSCVTERAIVDGGKPVLMVTRDLADGAWNFLTGDTALDADTVAAPLQHMLTLDPGLRQLADLAPGWMAWRVSHGAAWERGDAGDQLTD